MQFRYLQSEVERFEFKMADQCIRLISCTKNDDIYFLTELRQRIAEAAAADVPCANVSNGCYNEVNRAFFLMLYHLDVVVFHFVLVVQRFSMRICDHSRVLASPEQ